jgi:hypothetical protein
VANSDTGGVRAYITKRGSEVRNPDKHHILFWSRGESEEKYRIAGVPTIHGMDYHDHLTDGRVPYRSRRKMPRF